MEITNRIKDKVTDCLFFELKERRVSQAEFARIIALRHGIKFDKSVLSQIKYEKERNYSVIKDTSWLVLARHYRCMEDNAWETVDTKAFITVQTHLEKCQEYGICRCFVTVQALGRVMPRRVCVRTW